MHRDLSELFPGQFISKDDIEPYSSVAKLRGDDVGIMRKLVKKHGDDISAMFRDIKTNYLQWSKSEIKKKLTAYFEHGHDKQ